METLAVKKLHPAALLPTRAHAHDAGLDLYATEGHQFGGEVGETVSIGTGISIDIKPGWVALVCPRSGLAAHHGITVTNGPGVIDAGYTGEVKVLLTATRGSNLAIKTGDRIAQLVITPVFSGEAHWHKATDTQAADTQVVAHPSREKQRGDSGFGDSGGVQGFGSSESDL